MAEKKHEQSGFTVSDRRLFTADGELRTEVPEEKEEPKAAAPAKEQAAPKAVESAPAPAETDREMPPPPSHAEQEAHDRIERRLLGDQAKEFEMTFERFLASLYMTAMLQLGLMRQQGGQPQVDIIGARQTIDTLNLIADKTKGNLTPTEQNFLQNSLYELRMAYVEVTNAIARPPQPGPATGTSGR